MKTMNLFTRCLALAALLLTGCAEDEITPPRVQPKIVLSGEYSLWIGQPLSSLTPVGTAFCEAERVEGAFAWKDGTTVYDRAGQYEAAWVFTPADETRYAPVEGVVAVTVRFDLYVCGEEDNVGKVWKNGEVLYTLTEGNRETWIDIFSLFVSEGDVYTCGQEFNPQSGSFVSKIWKNDRLLYALSDNSFCSTLSVSEGHVYSGGYGYEEHAGNHRIGTVWKDGEVLYRLNDGSRDATIESLSVFDGHVYSVGYEENASGRQVGKVWKDGAVLFTLSDGSRHTIIYSLFIDKGNVYSCGYEYDNSIGYYSVYKIWKNDRLLYTLSDKDTCLSLFVSEGNVYGGGDESVNGTYVGKVWKNGEELYTLDTPGDGSICYSLFISEGNVYTCGTELVNGTYVGKVWQNEKTLCTLTDGSRDAFIRAIFIY